MAPADPQEMKFDILAVAQRARHGALHLPHSIVKTPVFMPVGTQGTMKVSFFESFQVFQLGLIFYFHVCYDNTYFPGNFAGAADRYGLQNTTLQHISFRTSSRS